MAEIIVNGETVRPVECWEYSDYLIMRNGAPAGTYRVAYIDSMDGATLRLTHVGDCWSLSDAVQSARFDRQHRWAVLPLDAA